MTAKTAARVRRRRHEEAADWLLRNRAAVQSSDQARAFQEWLARDPENRRAYKAAERLLGEARNAILADPKLRKLKTTARTTAIKATLVTLFAIAAGGAFFAADGPMRIRADAISDANEMPVLTLRDGSILQLNAGSAAAFDFTPTRRIVRLLRGEGFFQVAKDSSRPFIVEAGGGRATALGTAFDVRVGEDATEVTVVEHAVSLGSDGTRVKEGEQATYDTHGRLQRMKSVNTDAVLAWRHGQLVVDNARLADVVAEIGRHFSGRIVIPNHALAERKVSGTLKIVDTKAALDFLEQSLGIRVIRLGPVIILQG